VTWRIRGTYFESCNCDVICPCRRVDGVPGGRSTHGVCMGVLSWLIEEGGLDDVDLAGIPVALAVRYSDDEPGSPWTWILYLDAAASPEQRAALEGIFTGRNGGDAEAHFPWRGRRATSWLSGRSRSTSTTRGAGSGSASAIASASTSATAMTAARRSAASSRATIEAERSS
jgi:hypothetical protein